MTQTNADIILNGFRKCLTDEGYALRSADSYCSGIRRVNTAFFIPMLHKDMFDEVTAAIPQGTAVNWLTALGGAIGAEADDAGDPADKKRLQDTLCHLRKFIEYIAEAQDEAGLPETEEYYEYPEATSELFNFNLGPISNREYFEHDFLVKIFASRIQTRDSIREDNNVFFPIRILGKLFSDATRNHRNLFNKAGIRTADGKQFDFRRWYVAWVRRMVEDMVFHTTKGDYRLSEIEGLKIERSTKRAWIIAKKDERTIPVQSEGPSGMVPMKAATLRDIHLDPSDRMEDIIIRLEPVLVIMRMLTDDIKNAVKGQTVTIKDKVVALDSYRPGTLSALGRWYCNQVDWNFIAPLLPHLCTELNYIAAATHLTAISAAHNHK